MYLAAALKNKVVTKLFRTDSRFFVLLQWTVLQQKKLWKKEREVLRNIFTIFQLLKKEVRTDLVTCLKLLLPSPFQRSNSFSLSVSHCKYFVSIFAMLLSSILQERHPDRQFKVMQPHTRTHQHAATQTHAHSSTRCHTNTRTLINTQPHKHTHTHQRAATQTHAHSSTHSLTNTNAQVHFET